jgi:hypothetical protein
MELNLLNAGLLHDRERKMPQIKNTFLPELTTFLEGKYYMRNMKDNYDQQPYDLEIYQPGLYIVTCYNQVIGRGEDWKDAINDAFWYLGIMDDEYDSRTAY